MNPDQLLQLAIALPIFVMSLTLHEFAHAQMALRLGDDTAALLGRTSLNPLRHLDPVGSVLMPILGFFSGFVFGWAKPVPMMVRKLRGGMRDVALVAAAGPAANLVLLVIFAVVLRVLLVSAGLFPPQVSEILLRASSFGVTINALLMVFNLLPLPPLDGSKVAAYFLPVPAARQLLSLPQGASMVLLLVVVGSGALDPLLGFVNGAVLAFARP